MISSTIPVSSEDLSITTGRYTLNPALGFGSFCDPQVANIVEARNINIKSTIIGCRATTTVNMVFW
jgi:hypothetical protein